MKRVVALLLLSACTRVAADKAVQPHSRQDDQVETCNAVAHTAADATTEIVGRVQHCLIDKYQWTLADMDSSPIYVAILHTTDSLIQVEIDSLQHLADSLRIAAQADSIRRVERIAANIQAERIARPKRIERLCTLRNEAMNLAETYKLKVWDVPRYAIVLGQIDSLGRILGQEDNKIGYTQDFYRRLCGF